MSELLEGDVPKGVTRLLVKVDPILVTPSLQRKYHTDFYSGGGWYFKARTLVCRQYLVISTDLSLASKNGTIEFKID